MGKLTEDLFVSDPSSFADCIGNDQCHRADEDVPNFFLLHPYRLATYELFEIETRTL